MTDYNRGYTSGDKHHHSRSSEKHHGAQDSKKPLFSNMVWTRESAADEDRMAASLLSRIQQGPASLLERISSPKVKSEPGVDPTRGIGDNVDMEEGMMLGNHVNPRRMIQPTSDDLKLADMLIASALADATKAAPKTTTSVSGTAVSDSVATTSANLPRDSNLPAVGGSETHDGGVDVTPSRTELIEQAKQLLIPIITQNARLRDPDADAETIRNRVMSMITDEQCLDFLKIARSVRDQIRSNGRNTSPKDNEPAQTQAPLYVKASMAGNSPLRAHPNETLDARGFSDPVRKSETPGVGPNIIISQTLSRSQDGPSTRSVSPAPTTSTTQAISTMPRLKSPPTAPKAMRLARRTSHSNPSIPSNPAALRIAASPYEAAYQRRHSPAPTAIIAVPSSPRLLRKRSASGDHHGAPPPPLPATEAVAMPSAESMSPKVMDSSLLLKTIEPSSSDLPATTSSRVTRVGGESELVEDGPSQPVPMMLNEPREEIASQPTSQPPPLPVEERITVKAEPCAVAEPFFHASDSININVPTPMLSQEPSIVPKDHVEHNDPRAIVEHPSPMANAPTADVIEPVQLGTQAPPEKEKEKEASVTHEEHTDVVHVIEPSSMEDAPLLLPSLLHVTAGSRTPDVIEVVFEVNKALADASRRWSAGQASYDASSSYASVYLLCLPMEKVKSIHERIGLTASAEEYGDALWNIQTAWPPQGKLVIEMNSNKATHTTFVPQQLGPRDGPLEVSKFLERGKNTLRLIQLGDSSSHLFVLLAREPLAHELKWHSLVRSFNSPTPLVSGSPQITPTIAAF